MCERRARVPACILAGAAALCLAAPSLAEAAGEGFAEYRTSTANQALLGLSSILSAPVDPIAETISPPEDYEEIWGAPVTSHLLGVGAGFVIGIYRLSMGLADLVFSPLPMLPLSPPLRFAFTPDLVNDREEDPEWLCDMDGWGEEPRGWGYRLGVIACFLWKGSAAAQAEEG